MQENKMNWRPAWNCLFQSNFRSESLLLFWQLVAGPSQTCRSICRSTKQNYKVRAGWLNYFKINIFQLSSIWNYACAQHYCSQHSVVDSWVKIWTCASSIFIFLYQSRYFKCFIILAVICRIKKRVCGAHVRAIAPGATQQLPKKYRSVVETLETVSDLTGPRFKRQFLSFKNELITAWPTALLRRLHVHLV